MPTGGFPEFGVELTPFWVRALGSVAEPQETTLLTGDFVVSFQDCEHPAAATSHCQSSPAR